jgi:hypothetical protein
MILEIIIVYFISKLYYNLAIEHGKSKLAYTILAAVVYFGVIFLVGILLGILAIVFEWELIFEMSNSALSLIGILTGTLATWGLRLLLKKNWERGSTRALDSDLLDGSDTLAAPED